MADARGMSRRARYGRAARAALRSLRTPSPPHWELAAFGGEAFEGAVVVVTGGAGLIGSTITGAFLAQGATVHVIDTDVDAIERLPGGVDDAERDRLVTHSFDLVDDDPVVAFASSLDRADVVVHCAGINLAFHGEGQLSVDDWRRSFDVNVVAVARLTDALAEHLRAARGSVVVLSSSQGSAASQWPVYATAKAALDKWVIDAARRFAPDGVRVNAVVPAFVTTKDAPMDQRADTVQPLGGGSVPTEAIAHAVSFLADRRRSPMTTGQHLRVDGGNLLERASFQTEHAGFR